MQCAIQNHIFVHLTTEDGHDKTSMLDLSNSKEKSAKLFSTAIKHGIFR